MEKYESRKNISFLESSLEKVLVVHIIKSFFFVQIIEAVGDGPAYTHTHLHSDKF